MTVSSGPKKLSDLVENEFARIEKAFESGQITGGVPTGFYDLDRLVDGIHPGDIILAAGRPLMGKSDFLLNVAMQFAAETSRPVGIFSLRHDQPMVCRRMLAAQSRIPMHRMVRRLLSGDWPKLTRAAGILADLPVQIEAGTSGTDRQLLDFIESMEGGADPGLIVIDGFELMTPADRQTSHRAAAETLILFLRDLARKRGAAIIVSLTTPPGDGGRGDKRPVIDDLGEWESLAADGADMVLFFHRPEAYLVYTQDKGVVELIVAKNNYGATGTIRLAYLEANCRFANLAEGFEKHIPARDNE
ncbi:MAG: replicative DNA helicase [Desulfobulbaceae bacterium]|jgi:replicative DNA helicase|nr:replicative DNA helicase [Desulfobulbaceae bacterium]